MTAATATADAGEHLLEDDLRQRVAVGEVRVGRHLDLAAAVRGANTRALDRHAAATERHAAVLMAMPDGRSVDIVTALRADHHVDLLGHQLRQHPEPTPTLSASNPSFAAPASSPSASCTRSGKRLELRVADLVGCFV